MLNVHCGYTRKCVRFGKFIVLLIYNYVHISIRTYTGQDNLSFDAAVTLHHHTLYQKQETK